MSIGRNGRRTWISCLAVSVGVAATACLTSAVAQADPNPVVTVTNSPGAAIQTQLSTNEVWSHMLDQTANGQDRLNALHAPLVRLHVGDDGGFPDLPEIKQGQWDFSNLDDIVGNVFTAGEQPVMNIKFAPDWMWTCYPNSIGVNGSQGTGTVADTSFATFAQYMARLVSYYNKGSMTTESGQVITNPAGTSHAITYWELWNEPDLSDETPCAPAGGGPSLSPDQYVQMWNAVTAAMLAVDPSVKFVGPATAGAQFGSSQATGNQYVDDLMANATTKPAAISFHGYGYWDNSVSDKTLFDGDGSGGGCACGGITDLVNGVKSTRTAYPNTPVWLTEVNVNAAWNNDPNQRPASELAASWWGAMFAELAPLGVGVINQYDLVDSPQFGLLDSQNGGPHIAYYVFGLLDQAFPKGTTILSSSSTDPGILSLAGRKPDGTVSVLVVNRKLVSNTTVSPCGTGGVATPVDISLDGLAANAITLDQIDKTSVNCADATATAPADQTLNPSQPVSVNFPGYGIAVLNLAPAQPPSIDEKFAPSPVPLGGTTTLTFTVHNGNSASSLSGVGFTDSLPSGLTVAASPNVSDNCGGTVDAAAGAGTLSLSGGGLNAGTTCTVSVSVTGTSAGTLTNTTGTVTSTEAGNGNTASSSVTVGANPGDWTGAYGSDGYVLAGWNGDQMALPAGVTESLDQGQRYVWLSSTSDGRGLQSPDGSTRAMAAYYDDQQVKAHLSFPAAYSGNLHLYALDADLRGRRESVTVDDGSGPRTVDLTGDFSQGAWVTLPVSVAAGGTVSISVTREAGPNAVLSGIMLGDAGAPPAPPYQAAPQGSWTGVFGSAGYVLAGWSGDGDLAALPGGVTESLDQGQRYVWLSSTSDVRGLQSPDGSTRAMAAYYDDQQVKAHLSFPAAYSGNLHLYALDADLLGRRESITVDDGSGPRTVHITTDFSQGAWVTFPVSVAAGGTVSISVTRDAGPNAVLSGIMLGDAGSPPASSSSPQ